MFIQTFTAKRVKTWYSFGFGVGIEANRTSNLFLEIYQKRLHQHWRQVQLRHALATCKIESRMYFRFPENITVRFSWLPVGDHVPKLSSASVTFYCLSEMTLQLLSERFIFAQPAEMVKVNKFKTYVENWWYGILQRGPLFLMINLLWKFLMIIDEFFFILVLYMSPFNNFVKSWGLNDIFCLT